MFAIVIWINILVFWVSLPAIGASKVKAGLERYLHREQVRLAQLGRTYTVTRRSPIILIWSVLFCLLGWALFSLAAEGADQADLNFVMLFMIASISLCGLPLVLSQIGIVALGEDAIYTSWLGRRKRLRYDEIENIREYFWLVPPYMRLRGNGTTIYIHRHVEELDGVYKTLSRHSDHFHSLIQTENNQWKISRRFQFVQGSVLFTTIMLFVGGITWGIVVSQSLKLGDWPLVIFLNLLFVSLFGGLFVRMELKRFTPSELAFIHDTFRYRLPFRGWHVVARSAIHEVTLIPENQTVHFKGTHVTTRIYPLVIHLNDGTKLTIDDQRAIQFGTSTQAMFAQIQTLLAQK